MANEEHCCPVMRLVLERRAPGRGLDYKIAINPRTGKSSEVKVLNFRRHKKSDSELSAKFRNATFAEISFCPFCGRKAV